MKQKTHCRYYLLFITVFFTQSVLAQKTSFINSLSQQNHWVDSVYKKMSRKERIGQLFYVRAHTNKGKAYEDSVGKVIQDEHIGGVVFFQGGPVRHANLINVYQKLSKVPLLIAMDGEWGLGMRLDSSTSYPYQMTLGAIQDNTLIYKMGQMIGSDFRRLGMHINFAPDMDVNNNPNNPVINYRSFGDNKYNVARKGIAYFTGMQDAGLIVFAKHFPGHGDTNVDSHLALPQLPFTRARLDSLEEYPFREAINAGISGIMIAHMNIPALDTTKNLPSTLSRPIVTGVLKDSLGFKGIVASDAMEMQGVVKDFPNGEADVRAFLAGNDLIELSVNSANGAKLIRKAIRKKKITKEEFEAKVKKLLAAKYWAGLNNYRPTSTANLLSDINRPAAAELFQQLSDAAVTVLKGDSRTLRQDPFKKTAIISIGVDRPTVFQLELSKWYVNSMIFLVGKSTSLTDMNRMLQTLKGFDQVFVSIHDTRTRPASKLDYSSDVKYLIAALAAKPNAVTAVFANPYTIAGLPGIEKSAGIIEAYQKDDALQRSAVKVITGLIKPAGKLPVSVNTFFPTGTGISF
ncbi:glycoside hydrolase family 3 protein [Mucilaginibacter sp. 14171R-50]|uniref:glycoside hydrolase family 3 protein n=1 Tax=Mucilaginibacter sp. 14171R-50 TaxID=2703789 RepID=UPI00138B22C9|nr:glycoside hydrolase family 3 N-terminal domain-containing protein [Mucilaginibacter sp. 14171R-50]QHS54720.1 glycoside hydrolase family 3 protein [Mucilaginibacter sp. 14171R-50]